MKVTCWYKLDKDENLIFNHIENGWIEGDCPIPKNSQFTNQKCWKNNKWTYQHAFILKNKIRKINTRIKPRPPRYDDIFFEGLEYLNTL